MRIEHGDSDSMEITADMTRPLIDKMDPAYIAACVEEMPTLKDPNEVMIRGKVEELLASTFLAKSMSGKASLLVRESFRDLYTHRSDPAYVHRRNQEYAAEFAAITNAKIVSGEEHLKELGKKIPVIFSANHDAIYRMGGGLTPEELRKFGFNGEHAVEDIHYPHIPFYAPLYPVAKLIGDDVYMVDEEEPGTLGELYRATGSIDFIPASVLTGSGEGGAGRVEILTEAIRRLFEEHQNSALTIFPEGATTGKRNGGNTRHLGRFHAGLFAIASSLEVPIVLLAHRFNPNKGFEISIAGVVRLGKNSTREEIQGEADRARGLTQAAFDQLHAR